MLEKVTFASVVSLQQLVPIRNFDLHAALRILERFDAIGLFGVLLVGVDEGLEVFLFKEAMGVEALQQLLVFAHKINKFSALSHHSRPCCFIVYPLQLFLGDVKGVDEGEGKSFVQQFS